jgi:beta-lactamase superfamily II metal-dependent hydrolase
MRAALKMHETYIYDVVNPPDLAGVQIKHFRNPYPMFTDTNNLSLVSFVSYDGVGILIPGDLERAGWEAMIEGADFRECLNAVTVFIASHHGRESGYCAKVFDYCSPEVIVLSDKGIQHETQEHCYDQHATGIQWGANGTFSSRYVLTTRSDGHIRVTKTTGSQGRVQAYGSQLPDVLRTAASF